MSEASALASRAGLQPDGRVTQTLSYRYQGYSSMMSSILEQGNNSSIQEREYLCGGGGV